MPPRIGIIGPHRRRTGTGPFVAGYFRNSGCRVTAWDRTEAGRLLDPAAPPPDVDAVAICSPAESHFSYLAAAVGKGLHVFCEKPIVWPESHAYATFQTLIVRLAEVLESARTDGLVVHENTQWTYTLNDFRRIAGEVAAGGVSRFHCELSPSAGTPPEMLMECSAHANAILIDMGCAGVEEPQVRFDPGDGSASAVLTCDFQSRRASGGFVQVQYRFTQQAGQPRHAAYEINGRRIERRVDMKGYRVFLCSESEQREIADPLRSSVEDFLIKMIGGTGGRQSRILRNIQMSWRLLGACRDMAGARHA